MSVTDFFVICSGANSKALALATPQERSRAVAVGASVILTTLFAGVSAGYAGAVAFGHLSLAVAIGLLWSSIVFATDRLIVSTIHRRPVLSTDTSLIRRIRHQRRAFVSVLPRLTLTALISLPISLPILLRLFDNEINAQIARNRHEAVERLREDLQRQVPELLNLRIRNATLEANVEQKEARAKELQQKMLDEPTGRLEGLEFEMRRAAYLQARRELDELRTATADEIAENRRRLQRFDSLIAQRERLILTNSSTSFLLRLKTLLELRTSNSYVAGVALFVATSFVLIQVFPVVARVFGAGAGDADFGEAVAVMANASSSNLRNYDTPSMPSQPIADHSRTVAPAVSQRDAQQLIAFLCHCSEDKPIVRSLARRLENDGINVWLDEERILPGQIWHDEITKAVRAAHVVIVCLSQKAIQKSGYIQRELRFALDVAAEQPEGTIFLIPVKLEPCDAPLRLRELQFVRIFEPAGYELLLKALLNRASQIRAQTS